MTETERRRQIRRQALSVALATAPFGVVFGVTCADGGLSIAEAVGFSTLVFTGSAQFAAVGVLSDGGGAIAAVVAGLLLNLRSLVFGVLLAPVLTGSWLRRAALSQLVIDESTAVATAQDTPRWQRHGFVTGGLTVFVCWNLATIAGVTLATGDDDFITGYGLDAAAPAAFLALLWSRLADDVGRTVAAGGAVIAALAVPLTPAGIPILAAMGAVVLARTDPAPAPDPPAPDHGAS